MAARRDLDSNMRPRVVRLGSCELLCKPEASKCEFGVTGHGSLAAFSPLSAVPCDMCPSPTL